MNGQTRSLLRKEWREARWKAAFGAVLLGGACAIHLRTRMMPDEGAFFFIIGLGGVMLPLLAAIGAVGADREAASLYFLQALPVAPWRILAAKLTVAFGVALAPLVAGWAVCVAMAGGREISTLLFTGMSAASVWVALQVIVWTVAFGMRQPAEARVGLAGIFVMVAWSLWVFVGDELWVTGHPMMEKILFSFAPWSMLNIPASGEGLQYWLQVLLPPVVQTLEAVILFAWAARRFKSLRRSRA